MFALADGKQNDTECFRPLNRSECGDGWDLAQGLSLGDRFLVLSMLSDSTDTFVPFSQETKVGGRSVRQILEFGELELFLALKPRKALASNLWSLLVRVTTASIGCLDQNRAVARPWGPAKPTCGTL